VPWASESDVSDITGIEVSAETVARAQSTIETIVGRMESELSTVNMRSSDLSWLKKAVAYQAAWMSDQPDLFTRSGVEQLSQDGASVRPTPDGQTLAPFARKALRRLGWKGTRSIYTPSTLWPDGPKRYPASEGVVAVHDYGSEPWRPLPT
jgi:hypothetical protein